MHLLKYGFLFWIIIYMYNVFPRLYKENKNITIYILCSLCFNKHKKHIYCVYYNPLIISYFVYNFLFLHIDGK